MKKRLLALLIVCTMTLTACGGGGTSQADPAPESTGGDTAQSQDAGEASQESTPAASGDTVYMTLSTGGTSGTYYPYGGAMAALFNKYVNVNVNAQATGASKENLRLIANGESELAIVQNDSMDHAYTGTNTFEGEQLEGFSTIASLYPEIVQIIVSPDSGITSIEDMAGKRISVGDAGSGTEANTRQVLEVHGLSFDDISVEYLSFSESADAFKNGRIDGFFMTAGVPNSAVQELMAQQDVVIVQIADDKRAELINQYPFYANYTIKASDYSGLDADVECVTVMAALACATDLDEELVYELTKALFENQAELAQGHAKGAELSLESAVQGVSVPFHPGAARYYEEQGISVN